MFHVSFIVVPNTVALSLRKPQSSGKSRDICRHDKNVALYNTFFEYFLGFLLTRVLFGSYISFLKGWVNIFWCTFFVCGLKFVTLHYLAVRCFEQLWVQSNLLF